MEKGQSEVTNKIRSAIKEKLSEISDFVDDELPEYIMILVANQRSKAQIEKDLSLFLRNDTVNFTNWLWELLNNLKVCTKSNQSSASNNETNVINKPVETDEDAVVLDFDPAEHETDFLSQEDTNDSLLSKSSSIRSSYKDNCIKEPPITKIIQNHKPVVKAKIRAKSPVRINPRILSQVSKEPLPSAVIPVKRKISEDEYDPDKPGYKKPSLSTSSRKYGGPAALQANKLLLKAVDDATKSVLHGKSIEDFYKPTPIKELTSQQFNHPSLYEDENMQKKRTDRKIISQPDISNEIFDPKLLDYPSDVPMQEEISYVSSPKSRTICLNPFDQISNTSPIKNAGITDENNYSYSFTDIEEVRPKSTHFIVTLDGVNRTSFKRKYEDDKESEPNSEDSYIDSEEEPEPLIEEIKDPVISPDKKLKLTERCKYWPACKNSDQCSYHHPTIACKCFPDCKFGDKCLYIHPNCKFDALCSRKDCPFTHASKRKLPLISVPVKLVPVKNRRMKTVCKYYPKCTSRNCPFIHPKLCRYGTDCRLPTCLFGHFPVPTRSQMKWHATVS